MKLTQQDIQQLKDKGISLEEFSNQVQILTQGIPFVDLRRAATLGDGILKITPDDRKELIGLFEARADGLDLLKFTPASGAATRMFKFLFEFLEGYKPKYETINAYINRKGATQLRLFFVGLDNFPFFRQVLKKMIALYGNEDETDVNTNRLRFVKALLRKKGMNYGAFPKGLIPFHKYKNHVATPFEEHLFEAAHYASSKGLAKLHFTISEQHQSKFEQAFQSIQDIVTQKTGVQFEITYSYQASSTDTIAVDLKNKPFRTHSGDLLFRPGGHGALIKNLNEQDADIIFIKNIDNVVVYQHEKEVASYKKVLAGLLLKVQQQAFEYIHRLGNEVSEEEVFEIAHFLRNNLNVILNEEFEKFSKTYQVEYLLKYLQRPIRVCGMVRNEGEPGGGPFWIKEENGKESLQIIESVQIDPNSKRQQKIKEQSTHFNPVDIVCGIRDHKGHTYDLYKFTDPKAGFIAQKTFEGKAIKALEHPGLWNGGMANWNTIFVEVPLITFNPVKTVNDLLKPAHQIKR